MQHCTQITHTQARKFKLRGQRNYAENCQKLRKNYAIFFLQNLCLCKITSVVRPPGPPRPGPTHPPTAAQRRGPLSSCRSFGSARPGDSDGPPPGRQRVRLRLGVRAILIEPRLSRHRGRDSEPPGPRQHHHGSDWRPRPRRCQ